MSSPRLATCDDDSVTFCPSGEQYPIAFGEHRATVVEVGGGIREYRVGSRDVLHPYDADQMCDAAHGAPLIPWPNRLADGQYAFDGSDYQLALTEPTKHNAIHGLVRWRSWTAVEHQADRVVMACRLRPMSGYPFALDLEISYRLDASGLTVVTTATNVGTDPAPYGSGQHPYLSPGDGRVDDCTLRFGAQTRIVVDEDRQLPTGVDSVPGSAFDFGDGRQVGDLAIDHAFTELDRDAEGRAWVRLTGPDERTVELWVDRAYPLLQLFTADALSPDRRRRGLGTEPMTCPPNAFRTGEGVLRLEPGGQTRSSWGVTLAD